MRARLRWKVFAESVNGKPVSKQMLDVMTKPNEITGNVGRSGDLLILCAGPVIDPA
jgi:hypothetical protein